METPQTPLTESELAEILADDAAPVRPAAGRPLAVIIASALLGAVIGGGVVFLAVVKPSALDRAPEVSSPASGPPAASAPAAPPDGAAYETASSLASAKQLAAAGRLREARDEYLTVLLMEPTHKDAMSGLVRVVSLMAKGNRTALRREADQYLKAIATGTETEEHYTVPAMEILARALLVASGERVPPPQVASPPEPVRPAPARTSPRPSAEQRAKPRPRPPLRTERATTEPTREPAAAQPAPPPPPPPPPAVVDVNEPFVTVVIGPFGTNERAAAITGELTIAGYAARLRRQGEGSYVITLGPYRKSEAERAAGFVKSRFGQNVPVSLTAAP
jgi:cell division septation protein DedD